VGLFLFLLSLIGLVLSYQPAVIVVIPLLLAFAAGVLCPEWLLVAVFFMIPFNAYVEVGGIPLPSELLKLFIPLGLVLRWLSRRERYSLGTLVTYPVLIFSLLVFVSLFRLADWAGSREILRLLGNVALFFCVLLLVKSHQQVSTLFLALSITTLLVCCYGLYQYFYLHDYGFLWSLLHSNLEAANLIAPWRNRIVSTLTTENELAAFLNLSFPCLVYSLYQPLKSNFAVHAVVLASVILCPITLALTFSRGGWLGFLVGTSLAAFTLARTRRRRLQVLTGILVFVGGLWIAFHFLGIWDTLTQRLEIEHGIVVTRRVVAGAALKMFTQHPIWGVGYANFSRLYTEYTMIQFPGEPLIGPHNVYLYVLSQLGVLGFVPFIWVFLFTSFRGLRYFSPGKDRLALYVQLAISSGVLTAMTHGFVDDAPLFTSHAQSLVWFLLGLFYALERFPKGPRSNLTNPLPDTPPRL